MVKRGMKKGLWLTSRLDELITLAIQGGDRDRYCKGYFQVEFGFKEHLPFKSEVGVKVFIFIFIFYQSSRLVSFSVTYLTLEGFDLILLHNTRCVLYGNKDSVPTWMSSQNMQQQRYYRNSAVIGVISSFPHFLFISLARLSSTYIGIILRLLRDLQDFHFVIKSYY